ncbi:MAG: sigma-54 dependent transcriptional regulator [Nitrospirota bacterium]
MTAARILIVEDSAASARLLKSQLCDLGYEITMAHSAEKAIALLGEETYQLIISDLVMPGMDGLGLLRALRAKKDDTPFIIFTAQDDVGTAVKAMKSGAFDYLKKGSSPDELDVAIKRALEFGRLTIENSSNKKFKEYVVSRHLFQSIKTQSPAMSQALKSAEMVAASPHTTVAIYGESGVGKEVLARDIHFASGGLPSNFVGVNCAAVPETLLESELFGHVKGAFTGADRDREGKFAIAAGGTMLLDEIGDMPLSLQVKLLRVLEERVYYKIGSDRQLPVGFRVIAATHQDLETLVRQGKFREDLFHRLNVFPIVIPPLRERKEDIMLFVEQFLPQFRQHQGKDLPGISRKAMDVIMAYDWPGNIRELRNCLERAAIIVNGELVRPEHLVIYKDNKTASDGGMNLHLKFNDGEFSLEAVVNRVLDETLKNCAGNKSLAAQRLKINRKMFNRKKPSME